MFQHIQCATRCCEGNVDLYVEKSIVICTQSVVFFAFLMHQIDATIWYVCVYTPTPDCWPLTDSRMKLSIKSYSELQLYPIIALVPT